MIPDPHRDIAVAAAGRPLETAAAVAILLHGRGATAESILDLARALGQDRFAYLAPEAAGNTWYPYSFLVPIERNEPWLSSAIARLARLVGELESHGFGGDRVLILGFSQGACLSVEFAARHARRYGGIAGLSGGLIGPPGTPRDYPGSLGGTPVFLGCSDRDPHVPLERVEESATVLERMGARVTTRIYPRMGHTVNADEITVVSAMMADLLSG
jgi:predicted esterase